LKQRVIILRSNSSAFKNVRDVAAAVGSKCPVHEILAEEVIGGRALQALWMRGTLIEVITEGAECAAAVKHFVSVCLGFAGDFLRSGESGVNSRHVQSLAIDIARDNLKWIEIDGRTARVGDPNS
jgi:hypothetical protein